MKKGTREYEIKRPPSSISMGPATWALRRHKRNILFVDLKAESSYIMQYFLHIFVHTVFFFVHFAFGAIAFSSRKERAYIYFVFCVQIYMIIIKIFVLRFGSKKQRGGQEQKKSNLYFIHN
jgi:hypothetical protein